MFSSSSSLLCDCFHFNAMSRGFVALQPLFCAFKLSMTLIILIPIGIWPSIVKAMTSIFGIADAHNQHGKIRQTEQAKLGQAALHFYATVCSTKFTIYYPYQSIWHFTFILLLLKISLKYHNLCISVILKKKDKNSSTAIQKKHFTSWRLFYLDSEFFPDLIFFYNTLIFWIILLEYDCFPVFPDSFRIFPDFL